MDSVCAAFALALLTPLLLIIAAVVWITSGGPVLFRQTRSGLNGRPFTLLKFRTMVAAATPSAMPVTRAGDSRITPVGTFLRKRKLDELPQLWNVLRGDMSLVGPRPDMPEIWSQVPQLRDLVLQLKPGLTGAASVAFSNEEKLLASVPLAVISDYYLGYVLPTKASLDLDYASTATFRSDCCLIWRTAIRSANMTCAGVSHSYEQFS